MSLGPTNIVFSQVDNLTNADNVGALTFGQSDGTYEVGQPSAPAYTWGSFQNSEGQRQGDVWIRSNDPKHVNPVPGSLGFVNIMHEISHALGLEHPFDDGNSSAPHLSTAEDNLQYTVMSYNNHPGMHYDFLSNRDYHYSLQLYDIAALQEIYGRNYTTRHADTTYDLGHGLGGTGTDEATPFIYTIWDGGGTDKIDASGYHNYGVKIDLRQGEFSSIGDNGSGSVRAENNVAIAFHSVIENAIGSDLDDIIIGNSWSNRLEGGSGDDWLYGDGIVYDGNEGFIEIDPDDILDPNQGIPIPIYQDDILIGGLGNDHLFAGAGLFDGAYFEGHAEGVTVVTGGNRYEKVQ